MEKDELAHAFKRLRDAWWNDTCFSSVMVTRLEHPALKEIVALGRDVVQLILEDLARTNDHWFVALEAITGENPATGAPPGDIGAMARAWLEWGKAKGLI